jgi:predicted negative regulator of RcsB-dependent stress response
VVALLLLLGVFWGFNAYGSSKDRRARSDYAKVLQKWPGEQNADRQAWQAVITELETYLNEHPGTAPEKDAQLDLARAYFQAGQYENALKCNQKVFNQLPRDQTLKFLAQYQMAFIYEALGKTDEALSQWNGLKGSKASQLDKEADWNIARLYAKKGEYSRAIEQYETALKDPGSYPSAPLIQNELASLKLKIDAPGGQQVSGQ